MSRITFSFAGISKFAKAMKVAAPEHLIRAVGRAFYLIGKSDIAKMKTEGLTGLNIKSAKFRNSFKFKATDSRNVKSLNEIRLSEYTGAKPFRIFQVGGDINPTKSRLLTILTPSARTAGGTRKYSPQELQMMIANKLAKVIKTRAGLAIIKEDQRNKKNGQPRAGAKSEILAWLKPKVTERKRIDFFSNFSNNAAEHELILGRAADEAIDRTLDDDEFEGD